MQKALLFDPQANEPCQTQAPKGEVIGLGGIDLTTPIAREKRFLELPSGMRGTTSTVKKNYPTHKKSV